MTEAASCYVEVMFSETQQQDEFGAPDTFDELLPKFAAYANLEST
jgi:hypothetical protein